VDTHYNATLPPRRRLISGCERVLCETRTQTQVSAQGDFCHPAPALFWTQLDHSLTSSPQLEAGVFRVSRLACEPVSPGIRLEKPSGRDGLVRHVVRSRRYELSRLAGSGLCSAQSMPGSTFSPWFRNRRGIRPPRPNKRSPGQHLPGFSRWPEPRDDEQIREATHGLLLFGLLGR
jgi:hypothetical protein